MELNKQTVPEGTVDLKKAKHAYSRSQLNLGLYILISLILTTIANVIVTKVTGQKSLPLLTQALISFCIMYGISFPSFLLLSKSMPVDPPEQHKLSIKEMILLFYTGVGLMMVGNVIGNLLNIVMTLLFGIKTADTTLSDLIFGTKGIIISLIAVIFAPIIEEILYRKVLIDRIRRYGEKTAIILSGVLFGLFHGNFSQFFYAMFLGMMFACIYLRTGKVIYTIILHLAINFWGSMVPILTLRNVDQSLLDAILNGDTATLIKEIPAHISELLPFLLTNFIGAYAMGITGIVLLFTYFRKRMKLEPAMEPVPKGMVFKTACVNVGFLLFLAVTLFQFVVSVVGASK